MIKKIFLILIVISLFFNLDVYSKSKKSKKKKTSIVRYVSPSIPVEISGSICYIEGKEITFYLGQVDGIKESDVLPVIKRGKKIGKIKVIWVGKNFSRGNLLTEGVVRVGDLISNMPTFEDKIPEEEKVIYIEEVKEDKTKEVPKEEKIEEVVIEKVVEKIPEKIPEKTPEKIPEKPNELQLDLVIEEKKTQLPLRGKIYLIHSSNNVEINLGTEHGVENDSILDAIRGNKNIGKIQIIRAGLFSSTGKIISVEKDESILREDTVIFPPQK